MVLEVDVVDGERLSPIEASLATYAHICRHNRKGPLMTIISFANSKGGAGKSTLCLLIASELAAAGTKVLIIDADEQQSCSQWAERCRKAGTLPDAIIIKPASTPEDLKSLLQESEVDIVLIDVQGSMNKMLIAAIVASDVTIVPAKANIMEMNETVKLFQWAEANLRRAPLRLVLMRVEGIDVNTTAFKDAVQVIRQNNLPAFGTFIRSRKVYEQFSNNAGSLATIAEDPSKTEQVEKARANIISLISDISELLKVEGQAR